MDLSARGIVKIFSDHLDNNPSIEVVFKYLMGTLAKENKIIIR